MEDELVLISVDEFDTDGNLIFFSPGKIIGNLEHMKSEMGNMSETLKAMKNSAAECGGQFQKRKPCKIYEFFESS